MNKCIINTCGIVKSVLVGDIIVHGPLYTDHAVLLAEKPMTFSKC